MFSLPIFSRNLKNPFPNLIVLGGIYDLFINLNTALALIGEILTVRRKKMEESKI